MEENTGLTRRDYIVRIRDCLDRLDNNIGGNPWMECMFKPYAKAWANFVLHNSLPVLGVDMEAIEGGEFVGATGLEQPDPEGSDSPEDMAGAEDGSTIPDSDLEDDLDEWDTEDDEAVDGDDV